VSAVGAGADSAELRAAVCPLVTMLVAAWASVQDRAGALVVAASATGAGQSNVVVTFWTSVGT